MSELQVEPVAPIALRLSGGPVQRIPAGLPGGEPILMAVGIASARPVDARVDGLATEPPPQVIGGNAKRAMDIALALIALVLAAPIMLLVAAAIRSSMGGPVLFSQERVGWGGRPFRCLKFRTMVTNGDEVLRRHLAADAEAKREWEATCKLADDPRVTRLGLLLRKSSLDELPQIVNILRGEMSCVGPRPVVPREIERYGALKDAYLDARPGLTGLWQTSGRSKLSYQDRVELDAEYARTWSLLLDVRIILRTIPALLKFDQSA